MAFMIQKSNSKLKFFYTQCGNWEAVTQATSARDACKESILRANTQRKAQGLSLTDVIVAMDLEKEMNGHEDSREAFIAKNLNFSQ